MTGTHTGVKGQQGRAELLLSVDDVCRALGIKQHTFYKYRKQYPSFKTVKVGNRTYMRPERLDAFLRELEAEQS